MSEPDIVARVIALAGLGVALTGLTWQIVSWLLVGSRVSVRVARARPLIGPVTADSIATIGVTASNRGRTSVSIVRYGLMLPGATAVVLGSFEDRPLPAEGVRIEAVTGIVYVRDFSQVIMIGDANELVVEQSAADLVGVVPMEGARRIRGVGFGSPWMPTTPLPTVIGAGDASTWFVSESRLRELAGLWGFPVPFEVRAFVELASGRIVKSRHKALIQEPRRDFALYVGGAGTRDAEPKSNAFIVELGVSRPSLKARLVGALGRRGPHGTLEPYVDRVVQIRRAAGTVTVRKRDEDEQR